MRNAMGAMASRGLGASSLAGQAMIQAAMESALPIAQADASVTASFEQQNLSNRQQSAMLAAEQRAKFLGQEFDQKFQAKVMNASKISDIANQNFTAEQQVALENSRIANSQNQTDQFFANLASQVSQFNASQQNAQAQFNAGQANTVERFNAELNNQRDQFNAQNQLVIAQANAQWRREIATADTAAINRANELNASAILDIGKTAYDNLWNYYADTMEWAWESAESELERINNLAIANLDAQTRADVAKEQSSSAAGSALGSLVGSLGSAYIKGSFGL